MQEKTRRGVGVDVDGGALYRVLGRHRADSTAADRGGGGRAGDCSKARRHREVRGQADRPGLLLVRWVDHGAHRKQVS